jgi:flagellar basal body-associated protein FliL
MQLAMELSNNNVLKELNSKLPLLEDAVIMVLSEQSAEVLTIEGKEKLKSKIINTVNSFLQKGTVNNIYFKTLLFS